ncbi:MAG: ABC transporter ATP-binding protein, partial [Verrucomicrobia bacterium]|nr:ABC transporter ATP-binding protein [Verrucomicrobiota bacterium]
MSIHLDRIHKRYGNHAVVNDASLEIAEGELVVLLGASGSGKSTILRMVAGLITPDEGRILLNDSDITDLPPQERGFGFVFQNYSIFPHMSIAENIEFGLKIRGMPAAERQARSSYLLDLVGLPGLGSRSSGELSGGQQQRVALARALAYKPKVLLLDEPFGALDVRTRVQLRHTLKEIIREVGVTTMMVTHDQEEAFELADRVAVVNEGRIEQYGLPFDIYYNPATHFAAGFVGDINFFDGELASCSDERCEIRLFDTLRVYRRGNVLLQPGQKILYGVRPEQIRLSLLEPEPYENGVFGVIEKRMFLGDVTRYSIQLANSRLLDVQILNYLVLDGMVMPYDLKEEVWLIWSQGSGIILADYRGN